MTCANLTLKSKKPESASRAGPGYAPLKSPKGLGSGDLDLLRLLGERRRRELEDPGSSSSLLLPSVLCLLPCEAAAAVQQTALRPA